MVYLAWIEQDYNWKAKCSKFMKKWCIHMTRLDIIKVPNFPSNESMHSMQFSSKPRCFVFECGYGTW